MDNSSKFTVISLCSGYCGIELGVESAIDRPLVSLAYVEREAFAVANLVSKMEASPPVLSPAPIWTDVKSFPAEIFRGKVSLITGGYPCTPFSIAGLKKGKEDPRHLWPYFRDIIGKINPTFVFFENVANHIKIGLSTVLSDLEEDGYRTEWGIFSAEEEGSPQQRKRVFILGKLGNANSERLEGCLFDNDKVGRETEEISSRYGELGDSKDIGAQGMRAKGEQVIYPYAEERLPLRFSSRSRAFWPHPYINPPPREGVPQYEWEPPRRSKNKREIESKMGRTIDGSPVGMGDAELFKAYTSLGTSEDSYVPEVMMVGNGVVPAVACLAWKTLMDKINQKDKADIQETLFGDCE